jgi:hypothetical protein
VRILPTSDPTHHLGPSDSLERNSTRTELRLACGTDRPQQRRINNVRRGLRNVDPISGNLGPRFARILPVGLTTPSEWRRVDRGPR